MVQFGSECLPGRAGGPSPEDVPAQPGAPGYAQESGGRGSLFFPLQMCHSHCFPKCSFIFISMKNIHSCDSLRRRASHPQGICGRLATQPQLHSRCPGCQCTLPVLTGVAVHISLQAIILHSLIKVLEKVLIKASPS